MQNALPNDVVLLPVGFTEWPGLWFHAALSCGYLMWLGVFWEVKHLPFVLSSMASWLIKPSGHPVTKDISR